VAHNVRDKLFKSIGLSQKLFSRSQYDAAKRRLQERSGEGGIGEELVGMGAITPDQARGLARAIDYRLGRDDDKQIARVIVDSGYADQRAVDSALKKQKDHYAKTGQLQRLAAILVEAGLITETQRKAAIKIHGIEKNASELAAPSDPPVVEDES
jgi:hypothetical protein